MIARKYIAVLLPGKATHYRPDGAHDHSAVCGLFAPEHWAYNPRDCDCLNCMKTRRYKKAMGKDLTLKERLANLRETINWRA